jgi:hypothetical protein
MRKKAGLDNNVPAMAAPALTPLAMRQKWAQLVQKIYQVAPLLCPKCQGDMKIVAFIETADIIEMILQHLGLWKPGTMTRLAKTRHKRWNGFMMTTMPSPLLPTSGYSKGIRKNRAAGPVPSKNGKKGGFSNHAGYPA